MKCEICEKNDATLHLSKSFNGYTEEHHYCNDCIKDENINVSSNSSNDDLFKFVSAMFGNNIYKLNYMDSVPLKIDDDICDICGSSYKEIINNGGIGCAKCYGSFYEKIKPSIQKIHGNTSHIGKTSKNVGMDIKINSKITSLKKELDNAIKSENYENAANIRDEIKDMGRGDIFNE